MQQQPYDAIIVPGYPYDGNGWNMVLKLRIRWANYLYKKGIAKNIIFSGAAVYTPFVESKVMALYAEAMGIPKENIFTEETAEHSTENIYYSYCLAKKCGFKKIALATDPFQTNNLVTFIRKYEIPVNLLPSVFDMLSLQSTIEPKIDASTAKKENFVSLTERETLYQRIRGTLGKKIIWQEEDLKKKRFIRKYERKKKRCHN